jgi:flagellar basal body rod protein FlgC
MAGNLQVKVAAPRTDDREVDAISSALSGIRAGYERVERASAAIAEPATAADPVDLAGETVELMLGQHQVEASIVVARTADEMYRAVLDLGQRDSR